MPTYFIRDGEGIIFDDWSHSQQTGSAYTLRVDLITQPCGTN
jgi:hypothetical protein